MVICFLSGITVGFITIFVMWQLRLLVAGQCQHAHWCLTNRPCCGNQTRHYTRHFIQTPPLSRYTNTRHDVIIIYGYQTSQDKTPHHHIEETPDTPPTNCADSRHNTPRQKLHSSLYLHQTHNQQPSYTYTRHHPITQDSSITADAKPKPPYRTDPSYSAQTHQCQTTSHQPYCSSVTTSLTGFHLLHWGFNVYSRIHSYHNRHHCGWKKPGNVQAKATTICRWQKDLPNHNHQRNDILTCIHEGPF